ncbi:unnamed protein product, partial [marine sediment metagenome]
ARGKMGTPTYRNLLYNKDFYTASIFKKNLTLMQEVNQKKF